jgi:hypothetical protein
MFFFFKVYTVFVLSFQSLLIYVAALEIEENVSAEMQIHQEKHKLRFES